MSDVGYLGCVQSWESGIPSCGFLEFKMREGSNVMEAGKWGAENERRSEGLGSWRSVVREWRLCCGVWVSEVGDIMFCCGKGMRKRGRDNAGRLGDEWRFYTPDLQLIFVGLNEWHKGECWNWKTHWDIPPKQPTKQSYKKLRYFWMKSDENWVKNDK